MTEKQIKEKLKQLEWEKGLCNDQQSKVNRVFITWESEILSDLRLIQSQCKHKKMEYESDPAGDSGTKTCLICGKEI